mmetsp:Transcript_110418/g.344213  ORF Transcript_110418/g.344213 Transcript_110418/m.344213 type:complete len:360 (+) Transcript_110418:2400-3479(+)
MRAPLEDDPILYDEDLVSIPYGAQPVRHNKRGTRLLGHQVIERLLHDPLALRVEGAGGLVEQKHRGVADHGSGDGDALLLPATQLRAPLAHLRRVATGEVENEALRIGGLGGRLALALRRALAAVGDVLEDAASEEHGLLLDQRHLLPQPAEVEGRDVVAVQADRALVRGVEALEQGNCRALPRATGAAEGCGDAGLDLEIEVREHGRIRPGRVAEGDVAELNLALDTVVALAALGVGIDGRGAVEGVKNVVHGRLRLLLVGAPLRGRGGARGGEHQREEDVQDAVRLYPPPADEEIGDEDDAAEHQEGDAAVVGGGEGGRPRHPAVSLPLLRQELEVPTHHLLAQAKGGDGPDVAHGL